MATINVTELAEKLNTTGRTARKFLRSITPREDQPGKGSRWVIQAKDVRSLTKKFSTWSDEHTRPEVPTDDDEVDTETE